MDIIEDYIQNRLSGRTQKTYRTYLHRYFKNKNPEKYIKKDIKTIGEELTTFIKKEQQKGTPPKTIYAIKSAVIGFLRRNDIELTPRIKDDIKYITKGTEAITFKETLTSKQLKDILQHGETKARAIFLIASSSGMRISEILSLTPENIDLNHKPTKIMISGKHTKTRKSRITFISDEATETLKAWLKEREQWLKHASKRYTNEERSKSTEDNRIFPMSYENTRIIWKRLTTSAGYTAKDPDTGIHKYGIHTLRAYFKSRMLSKGINSKIIDFLAGHKTQIDMAYYKLHENDFKEAYLKAMPELNIYEITPDLTKVNKDIKQLQDKISEQEEKIITLAQQKMFLQAGLELITDAIQSIEGKDLSKLTANDGIKALWSAATKDMKLPPELQKQLKIIKERQNKSK